MKVATIGYEQDSLAGVIARLQKWKADIVIDVRAVAASRRAGFSKTMLAVSLDEAGIAYVHLRALGTPKAGREAARAGRTEEMRKIFFAHLEEPASQLALGEAAEIVSAKRACLLCYEADAKDCHRAIVADRLRERFACEIVNL